MKISNLYEKFPQDYINLSQYCELNVINFLFLVNNF